MRDAILKVIADNERLMEEVKKVIFEHFDSLKMHIGMTDQELGQITRAKVQGRALVEAAFKEIALFKTHPEPKTPNNPAR